MSHFRAPKSKRGGVSIIFRLSTPNPNPNPKNLLKKIQKIGV